MLDIAPWKLFHFIIHWSCRVLCALVLLNSKVLEHKFSLRVEVPQDRAAKAGDTAIHQPIPLLSHYSVLGLELGTLQGKLATTTKQYF